MKLIKINNYYIIVSDEKYSEDTWILGITPKTSQYKFFNDGKIIYNKLPEPFADQEAFRKIVASQNSEHNLPSITFSDEVAKELGINNLQEHVQDLSYQGISIESINGFKNGYNQALSDNKDKLFTLNDLRRAFNAGREYKGMTGNGVYKNKWKNFSEYIQSLTKQEYEVELEMEIVDYSYPKGDETNDGNGTPVYGPKLTNNSIKVIKLLK